MTARQDEQIEYLAIRILVITFIDECLMPTILVGYRNPNNIKDTHDDEQCREDDNIEAAKIWAKKQKFDLWPLKFLFKLDFG